MAEKGTRQKRYTEESKLQAAKLIVEGGTTYHRAAQQLGVSDWALRCWVKAFRESGHLPAKGQAGLLLMKALIDEEVEQIAGTRYGHQANRQATRP